VGFHGFLRAKLGAAKLQRNPAPEVNSGESKAMWHQTLTKLDIAEQQLVHAIELFCFGERMVSAITLAGAADEILGKLVADDGKTNAMEREVDYVCEMFEYHFGSVADRKAFRDFENNARNELKHLCTGKAIEIDLEQEAVNLIERAINNFQILRPGPNSAFRTFDDKAAAWWRKRTNQFNRAAG
jgi:hypothetical protein